jgi:hypothetical protein
MADTTERRDVEVLLANFADYRNPEGEEDPWFTLDEINQQFAWDDIPEATLVGWLSALVVANKVEVDGGKWRWLS